MPVFPRRPTSRDDMRSALAASSTRLHITNTLLPAAKQVMALVDGALLESVEVAEWFDFGTVHLTAMAPAIADGLNILEAGLAVPPYPLCIFRMRSVATTSEFDTTTAEMIRKHDVHPSSADYAAIDELRKTGGAYEREDIYIIGQLPGSEIGVALFEATGSNAERITLLAISKFSANEVGSLTEANQSAAHDARVSYGALWVILNTKDIRRTIDEPSEKLNRIRAKRGRLPLRRVTHVNVAQYTRAQEETVRMIAAGDRVSPRMHLRRAHLRRLPNGTTIVIHAMIINAHKDPAGREGYKVIHR